MSIDEAKEELSRMKGHHYFAHGDEALDMAIHALEMQKKLAEFSGMDICNWVEDYDFEENNISEYEYEASVDNFLINEEEKEWQQLRECKGCKKFTAEEMSSEDWI